MRNPKIHLPALLLGSCISLFALAGCGPKESDIQSVTDIEKETGAPPADPGGAADPNIAAEGEAGN